MRIDETNIPNDLLWAEQDVNSSSLKAPNKYLPDQANSLSPIAGFLPKINYRALSLANSQLASIRQILSLEWSSITLGIVQPFLASHSEHSSRLCQHTGQPKALFNSTLRDLLPRYLDGLSWMLPLPLLNVSQSRCVARLLQSYVRSHAPLYTPKIYSMYFSITSKRTKANTGSPCGNLKRRASIYSH